MDLMQLEMFVATVEEGNFRRAADRVFRTQPAVSMALKKLQDELGAALFGRSGRNTSIPTEAGNILYQYAKKMLHLREEAKQAIEQASAAEANRIRIGASDVARLHILPTLVSGFRQQYPNARIEVFHQSSSRLIHGLKEHSLDFALVSYLPEDRDLEAVPLTAGETSLVVSRKHELASKSKISASDLEDQSLVINSEEPLWHEGLIEALQSQSVRLRAGIEATNLESIKDLVGMGLGVGVLPSIAVAEEVRNGSLVAIYLDGFHQELGSWAVSRAADASRLEIRAARRLVDAAAKDFNRTTALMRAETAIPPLRANG
ncbi:MAG TPA: LysR family transcriptional regulator [Blastocatellia bacterium]